MGVRLGADTLVQEALQRLAGARYGLVCNAGSVDSSGSYVFDRLGSNPSTAPSVVMVPEHGLFGEHAYMEPVPHGTLGALGVPLVSLYGVAVETLAPPLDVIKDLDMVVFDLQDVGSRYYTYLATMGMVMETCAKAGVPMVVCDRPNPIGGIEVEGNLVAPGFRSFVGYLPLCNRHGMSAGEAASMYRSEAGLDLEVEVLLCEGWKRGESWPATGLPFVPPSPNMTSWETALVYPGMCLLEGTNVSEGRGTTTPFLVFGAPWIEDPWALCRALNSYELPGVAFLPTSFTPAADKWAGDRCGGARLVVVDQRAFRPLLTGIAVLCRLHADYGGLFAFRKGVYEFVSDRLAIDLLLGDSTCREAIVSGTDPRDIVGAMEPARRRFLERRKDFLLYPR